VFVLDLEQIRATMHALGVKTPERVLAAVNQWTTQSEIDDLILQMLAEQAKHTHDRTLRDSPLSFPIFGQALIETEAIEDMTQIAHLPYVQQVALMPDAHRVKVGHVPVGGVVLSLNAIMPGIVGNDIACSVRFTGMDGGLEEHFWEAHAKTLAYVLRHETRFGQEMNDRAVVNDPDYQAVLRKTAEVQARLQHDDSRALLDSLRGAMRNHFGTSGDGNHFVELGLTNYAPSTRSQAQTRPLQHLGILSHFGSRSLGASIAEFFLAQANELCPLPKGMEDNAPLFFGTDGWAEDYWWLMQLAGEFAARSHQYVHRKLIEALLERNIIVALPQISIYTQHNFAWQTPQGIIHRKGATPAYYQQLGVIPATMGDITPLVSGKGNPDSLYSTSHGAGRKLSRGNALRHLAGNTQEYVAQEYGVTLIGGDKDEDPRAYKTIATVMQAQQSCASVIGQFQPKVVRMADPRFIWRRK
jgi:tRNA-splicing ligase RtcB